MHYRNDDQLFPGRVDNQIWEYPEESPGDEFPVERILSHQGAKTDARFELLWKDGEKSWMPYHKIAHLGVLTEYLEAMGASDITRLSDGNGKMQNIDEQVELGEISARFSKIPGDEIILDLGMISLREDNSSRPMDNPYSWYQPYSAPVPPYQHTAVYGAQQQPEYSPIHSPFLDNLLYLGNNRLVLIHVGPDGKPERTTYTGQQIAPYFDTADQLYHRMTNKLPLNTVEAFGGHNAFAIAFNSKTTRFCMPTQAPDGNWRMPERTVTRAEIDIDFLYGKPQRRNDRIFDLLGFTHEGQVNERGIQGYMSEQRKMARTNASLLQSMSRMVDSVVRTRGKPRPKKKKHHRGSGFGGGPSGNNPYAAAAAAQHRVRYGNRTRVFNNPGENSNFANPFAPKVDNPAVNDATANLANLNLGDNPVPENSVQPPQTENVNPEAEKGKSMETD
ncbi:hypothetical protein DFP72DRAFT_1130369 [Ephemerocybe angulata]|uniref:Uncharacterized protein n=1 Tax=Ephemerocybe angulata TaxID=980116 RepID=A0A8H6IFB6_9AGAR|nr:hypothetical protein DFP72DRAFT_1130369 [Tulosesus angulatus]